MLTYLLLNSVVLAVVSTVTIRVLRTYPPRPLYYTLALLLILTLVFDNVIILLGIVAYNSAHTLGVQLWRAPIEDFAYTIAAVMLVPYLWNKGKKQ